VRQYGSSPDSPLEEAGFELFVPLRVSASPSWWSRARKQHGAPEGRLSVAGPVVRIPLAPAKSQQRTRGGPGSDAAGKYFGSRLGRRGARLALRPHPVASRRELRAQDELALETARLETAVCLGDLIEGDPLGDMRPDITSLQQAEEPFQVLPEPAGMQRPHQVYRVDAEALAARQPTQQPPP